MIINMLIWAVIGALVYCLIYLASSILSKGANLVGFISTAIPALIARAVLKILGPAPDKPRQKPTHNKPKAYEDLIEMIHRAEE